MRGYSENADGDVVLTMSREDYTEWLLLFGIAIGTLARGLAPVERGRAFALLNRLEEGNPGFIPYEVAKHG